MAIPCQWEERKNLPGFGADGAFYPSVRLWTMKGALVPPATTAKNGLGCWIAAVETEENFQETMDLLAIRKTWRTFMANPVSYNWLR